MKKILLVLSFFAFVGEILGQGNMPVNQPVGSINSENYTLGLAGATYGYRFRVSAADTTALNLLYSGVIKTIPGVLARCVNDLYLRSNDASQWIKIASTASVGTVTSVGALSPLFTTANATTTPTFSLISQSANKFFASPDGSAGVASFRSIVAGDLPSLTSLAWLTTGNAGTTAANFLGTTDSVSLRFKVNNWKAGLIDINLKNTSFGQGAISLGTSGVGQNNAFGYNSQNIITTGQGNNSFGNETLLALTTGDGNNAIGRLTFSTLIDGEDNTGLGDLVGIKLAHGSFNTYVGDEAASQVKYGNYNVGIGASVWHSERDTTVYGSYNTFVGSLAAYTNTSGHHNTFIGDSTGFGIMTGSNNTILGARVTGLSSSLANNIILSDGAGNKWLQLDNGGALQFNGGGYGTAGYVLQTNALGTPPTWVNPTSIVTATPTLQQVTDAANAIVQNGIVFSGSASPVVSSGVGISSAFDKKLTLGISGGSAVLDLTGLSTSRSFAFPDAAGTIALTSGLSAYLPLAGGTMTGQFIQSTNGAVSTPEIYGSGTWYAAGSATTTKPYLLIEPTGTTSTAWSTAGTGLGINSAAGFVGRLADFQVGGSSKFYVNNGGDVAIAGSYYNTVGQYIGAAGGASFQYGSTTITGNASIAAFSIPVTTTTGTGTSAGLSVTANSLTTGNAIDASTTSLTTGNLMSLTSTSTVVNAGSGLSIAMSGANSTASKTVTGQTISVTNTGTTNTNNALTLTASGATTNNALTITAGDVLGPATQNLFNTVTTTGTLFGAATTLTIGGTPTTAITHNYSTNATATATTKALNIGTGGAAGSTTNINVGSAIGGTLSLPSPIITMGTTATVFNFGGGATTAKMRFFEPSASGANYSEFSAVAQAANLAYTFPPAFVAGGALTDVAGNGTLTWVVPSAGTPALTATQIAFGDGSNLMTSSSALTWDGSTFKVNTSNQIQGATTFFSDQNGDKIAWFHTSNDRPYIELGAIAGQNNQNKLVIDDDNSLAYYDNTAHTGFFGINKSAPSVALDVVGAFQTTGVNTLTNLAGTGTRAVLADAGGVLSAPVSDRKAKERIYNLDYGLNTIMKLRPVSFYYKDGWKNYGENRQVGFIAQEIESVMPNSVFTTPSTGLKGYNETDIIPVLVKAIQEQQLQIKELKKEIEKLKNKLMKLNGTNIVTK